MPIDTLIQRLAAYRSTPELLNIYAGPASMIRRSNLGNYLAEMQQARPTYLFVGEAPGPHGGRFTGIPFTDPLTLHCRPVRVGQTQVFSGEYQLPRDWLHFEGSSYPMWRVMQVDGRPQLLWNAVPFFPHVVGDTETWRNIQNKTEPRQFSPLIAEILALFPTVQHVVAVGKPACEAITWLRNHHFQRLADAPTIHHVDHPSYGRSNDFIRQSLEVLQNPTAHLIP